MSELKLVLPVSNIQGYGNCIIAENSRYSVGMEGCDDKVGGETFIQEFVRLEKLTIDDMLEITVRKKEGV